VRACRTLVLGGTRSGKSGYAEDLLPADAPVRYLATARRREGDAEWDARLDAHRARRPRAWTTVEEPDVGALVRGGGGPLLVDDLATWLTGVLDDAGAWERPADRSAISPQVDALVDAVRAAPGRVVLVSAEVGLGVVPATQAGRMFRDELGALNAALAGVCDEVVLLVAGLPLHLKGARAG
jgi:adenosylcobinamide kinase / adenosylcobinamide-phosphate guanylyltransferase